MIAQAYNRNENGCCASFFSWLLPLLQRGYSAIASGFERFFPYPHYALWVENTCSRKSTMIGTEGGTRSLSFVRLRIMDE